MSLCLVAIFKNEGFIMKEWIEHYIKEGVDHFFLIDNGSDDDYMKSLKQYIDLHIITLVIDPTKYQQTELYNKHFLELSKKYEWVIVCDLDEFIYSRNQFKTIKQYLNTLDKSISQIKVQWKVFGSSGFIEQPTSVIKSFTKRVNYDTGKTQGVLLFDNKTHSLCKSIIRSPFLIRLGIHSHESLDMSDNLSNKEFALVDENIINTSYLNLNHYAIQSHEWFMKVKATRGSCTNKNGNNIRNESYFKAYDINDLEDLELSLKSYSQSESGNVVSIDSSSL